MGNDGGRVGGWGWWLVMFSAGSTYFGGDTWEPFGGRVVLLGKFLEVYYVFWWGYLGAAWWARDIVR